MGIPEDGFVERRKHTRVILRAKFKCELMNEKDPVVDGFVFFNSKDISCGGVFLEGLKRLPEGETRNQQCRNQRWQLPGAPTGALQGRGG